MRGLLVGLLTVLLRVFFFDNIVVDGVFMGLLYLSTGMVEMPFG